MKSVIKDKTRWNPIRRGKTFYCSPACGFGCTWDNYQDANKKASALVKQLGPGWLPFVWENLGWHFRAEKGVCSVHGEDNYYTIYFNSIRQIVVHAKTPQELVPAVEKEIKKQIAKFTTDLNFIKASQ